MNSKPSRVRKSHAHPHRNEGLFFTIVLVVFILAAVVGLLWLLNNPNL
ncbi:MAG: hypothetical protein KGJ60_10010 [Verrucomicrobiota bacterium]|nr:hypothetical protein [Verrucomicrobiota bacterium]